MKKYVGISGYKAIWLDAQRLLDEARENNASPERIAELEGCVEFFREKGETGEPFDIPKDVQRMFERADRRRASGDGD